MTTGRINQVSSYGIRSKGVITPNFAARDPTTTDIQRAENVAAEEGRPLQTPYGRCPAKAVAQTGSQREVESGPERDGEVGTGLTVACGWPRGEH